MEVLSKALVKRLYYNQKLSTVEIGRRLGISPWRVLRFMRRIGLQPRTIKQANINLFEKKKPSYSIKKNLSVKEQKLKIAGTMLYWAEGGKSLGRYGLVDLANSDAEMIRIFLQFLRKICRIEERKLRVQLYCYSNQDIEKIKKYWYKVTSIPKDQFIKPYIRQDFRIDKQNKMQYGLIHLRYGDKKLLLQIEDWIKEYCKVN